VPTIAHAVSPQSTQVVGDLDGGPLPVHVDDDHDPVPCVGDHDAHLGRAIVHVQTQRDLPASTAIGGWLSCGAQPPPAPDRTAPITVGDRFPATETY